MNDARLHVRFRHAVSWNLAGALFNQGSTFAVNIVVARLFGRVPFGEYAMIQATLLTLSVLAQIAVGPTATRYLAELADTDRIRAGRIAGMLLAVSTATACAASGLLLLFAPWLAGHVLAAPDLATPLAIGAGYLLFNVMGGFQVGALAGLQAYRTLGVSGTASGLLYAAVCATSAWWGGLAGAVAGLAISAALQWMVQGVALRAELRRRGLRVRFDSLRHETGVVLHYALPGALIGVLQFPATWAATAMLARQPDGYAHVALLAAALNLKTLVLFLPGTVNGVCTSLFNRYAGAGDRATARRTYWMNLAWCVAAASAAGAALLVGGPLVLALYGRTFPVAYPVVVIMTGSAILTSVALAAYLPISRFTNRWAATWTISAPASATLVIVSALTVSQWQAWGVALGYLAADLVTLTMTLVVVRHIGTSTGPGSADGLARAGAGGLVERVNGW